MYLVVAICLWWGIIIWLGGDIFDGGGPFGPGGLFGPEGPFGPDSISVESEEIDEDDMEPFHPVRNNPYLNNPDYDPRHPFHPYDNNPHLYPHDLEEDTDSEDEKPSSIWSKNKKVIIAAVLCATFCFPLVFMGGLVAVPVPA
jgi:hypothetical protein